MGLTFPLRLCDFGEPEIPAHEMVLGYLPNAKDERFRFGWWCKTHALIQFEYLLGLAEPSAWPDCHWPREKYYFTREFQAKLRCEVCGGLEFRSDLNGHVSCLTCKSRFRLEIENATGRDDDWEQE